MELLINEHRAGDAVFSLLAAIGNLGTWWYFGIPLQLSATPSDRAWILGGLAAIRAGSPDAAG